ncbi:hypothetical protein [Hymenobacter cellulosilyticus]|uniref:Uncharacterized protein n=1 Tax=Hymenobacter cellulosilyticus TaxID=2932248 RepID=A0A8T9Q1J1_9BACT|nr:hypothetical protein [Hymenobacter cellulosilyticus]UOQ70301.1 hypothetical protein MUN79_16270 [Hymenobacter cellulosilyticus]
MSQIRLLPAGRAGFGSTTYQPGYALHLQRLQRVAAAFLCAGRGGEWVLLGRSRHFGSAADAWLALLLVLHTLRLAQWMLGFAGWYDSHDAFSTFMFYFPFSNWLAVGPALYFYFRSLTNQEFRFGRRHWWPLTPALAYLAFRLGVFIYDIGWWHWLQGQRLPAHFGTKGPLAQYLNELPLNYFLDTASYLLIGFYALRTLREYRAYARYLNDNFSDTDQIRFRWLRNVLVAVLVGTAVTLVFGLVNSFVSPLNYYEEWYDYLFTGLLIYYLSIAGLLTGHQLAGLRFQPATDSNLPPALHPSRSRGVIWNCRCRATPPDFRRPRRPK